MAAAGSRQHACGYTALACLFLCAAVQPLHWTRISPIMAAGCASETAVLGRHAHGAPSQPYLQVSGASKVWRHPHGHWQLGVFVWGPGAPASRPCSRSACPLALLCLQEPLTDFRFTDLKVLDTQTWTWSDVQVSFLAGCEWQGGGIRLLVLSHCHSCALSLSSAAATACPCDPAHPTAAGLRARFVGLQKP